MRIALSQEQYDVTWEHLLPKGNQQEHAAFLVADIDNSTIGPLLTVQETILVQGSGYATQEQDYLELSDESRIAAIKKAHYSNCCLIELHSHPFPGQLAAAFSHADMTGLGETVPNMLWRLPNRPYSAIVVAPSGFDALTWREPNKPERIEHLIVHQKKLKPTNYTIGEIHGRP